MWRAWGKPPHFFHDDENQKRVEAAIPSPNAASKDYAFAFLQRLCKLGYRFLMRWLYRLSSPMSQPKTSAEQLYRRVSELLHHARQKVVATANLTMVHTYYEIGRLIVEEEQGGNERAGYGRQVLKGLSRRLTESFGRGFSVESLDRMRYFYKTYSPSNSSTALTNSGEPIFQLSWSHYLKLMRIDNPDERRFYELEAIHNRWSLRELRRQIDSPQRRVESSAGSV